MIRIKNVTKKYNSKIANFDINLTLKPGEIYAIMGPNGSGKTTLIRQLVGFIKPDNGEILVDNEPVWKNQESILKKIGYVSGELNIFQNMKGKEYLRLQTTFRKNVDQNYLNELIEYFEIDVNKKISLMSKGMKQKIAIIAALVHKPSILIMDEPTSGLDPVMQERFENIILKINQEDKTTILLCSHIIREVSNLADHIGFLKNGKLEKEVINKRRNIEALEKTFSEVYQKEIFK